jgi:ABC-type antimicrobial peptide transport system permease subunit
MVLRQGALIGVLGAGIGLGAAIGLERFLASLVYGVGTIDPPTYVAAVLLVGGVVLLASYVPALRATRADPLESLRR